MSYSSEVLADSPRAYYRLGDASGLPQDSSGNGLNAVSIIGTLGYGSTSLITSDPANKAINFDGSDSFAVNDDPLLDLGDVFTVESWVKMNAIGATGGMVSKGWNGAFGAYYTRIESDGTFQLLASNDHIISTSTVAVTTAKGFHCVATKNAGDVHLYIDGVDRTGAIDNPQPCQNNTMALHIGEDLGDGVERINGVLDEIAIYATALNQTRVLAHYNAANPIAVAWMTA